MKKHRKHRLLAAAVMIVGTQGAFAVEPAVPAVPAVPVVPAVPADNSRSNSTDPSNMTATADAQKDNKSDRMLTQQIRKSVMADSSLSTYAHNVKIVSVNGTVTLNGVVRSTEEKRSVEMMAVSVAGQQHVVNNLKIAP